MSSEREQPRISVRVSPGGNIGGETAKSLPECKAALRFRSGRAAERDSDIAPREMVAVPISVGIQNPAYMIRSDISCFEKVICLERIIFRVCDIMKSL